MNRFQAIPVVQHQEQVKSERLALGGVERQEARDISINGKTIADVCRMTIHESNQFFAAVQLTDTQAQIADRRVGGLGIHLVRKLMDELTYSHEAGRNRLRFSKTFSVD